ncbi:HAD family phosphatase [Caulobacter sp. 17J65-9]|uniref:HAD family hydrolase n=1 Tax=Caulobacter sp. 17J65-9 TaxID=2709382 RepID=UPI0013CC3F2E|nr:HAD family phosphatase [Caulobacter sp. 17J65-9]NEX91683.1 HAD family phosphatase [Caulobacter sp. 17J65-9]
MFDAVIFDCDGVLVDSEVLSLEVELEAMAELGVTYDLVEYKARFLGLPPGPLLEALDADYRAATGRPLAENFMPDLQARFVAACAERLAEIAGVAAAVEALPLARAVASSSGAAHLRKKLDITGLLPLFDPHVYSAELVARGKPHPDVFLYAADRIGADPRRCLVLEDSVNGVRAALAAGMTVWGFAGGGHMDPVTAGRLAEAGAERVLGSWAEAEALWSGWGR